MKQYFIIAIIGVVVIGFWAGLEALFDHIHPAAEYFKCWVSFTLGGSLIAAIR